MLKGNIVALVTPFKSNNKVNYNKLIELIEYQIESKVSGILLLGTTGEGALLSLKEKLRIIKLAIAVINGRVKLIIGCGDVNTLNAFKFVQKIAKLDIDYLLVMTPFYIKTNDKGIVEHYKLISQASNIPIIIYHVPSRTGQTISINCLKELKKIKNIRGIKEASGNIEYIKIIKKYIDDEFILLGGNDELMVQVMENKGSGIISVLSNSHPLVVSEIMELCLNNHYKDANKILSKYIEYIKLLFIEPNPIPIKEVLNYLNYEVGNYRLPLCSISEDNKDKLIKELKEISKWMSY